jgi:hypothetical protein
MMSALSTSTTSGIIPYSFLLTDYDVITIKVQLTSAAFLNQAPVSLSIDSQP